MFSFDLHLIAGEGNLRVGFHIQKVCASQVVVPFFHPRPQCACINLYLDGGSVWACRIKYKRAVNVFEVSTDVSHHHVPGAKLGGGVSGLKSPSSHCSSLRAKT